MLVSFLDGFIDDLLFERPLQQHFNNIEPMNSDNDRWCEIKSHLVIRIKRFWVPSGLKPRLLFQEATAQTTELLGPLCFPDKRKVEKKKREHTLTYHA